MDFTPLSKISDVSFHQDLDITPQKIDFHKMKAEGLVGTICRAGQNSWEDEDFKDYWAAAKAASLLRGSYWFFDSRKAPAIQANIWRNQIGTDYPEIGLWLDLEESYGGSYSGERHWREMVNETLGRFPSNTILGVYTADWWWSQQIVTDPLYWSQFPLWISQFTDNPLNVRKPRPWLEKEPVLWQYTDRGDGLRYGVESSRLDLNHTSRAFYNLFNLPLPVEIPTEPGENMITYILTVVTAYLNGRETPGGTITFPAGSTLSTGFRLGDNLIADRVENNWYHITSGRRNGITISNIPQGGVWAYAGSSNGYLRLDETQVPTEPPVTTLPRTLYIATREDLSDVKRYDTP